MIEILGILAQNTRSSIAYLNTPTRLVTPALSADIFESVLLKIMSNLCQNFKMDLRYYYNILAKKIAKCGTGDIC